MYRTGVGYDFHQLAEGRRLVLGGVEIPSVKGLLGHSDADVLVHAVMDALLGAAGLGDIGQHFPDTDISHKDAESILLLRRVMELLKAGGWAVANIDSVIVLEEPRLEPFKDKMRQNIAAAVGVGVESINIKATTTERMDAIGRREAASAYAVAMLEKRI